MCEAVMSDLEAAQRRGVRWSAKAKGNVERNTKEHRIRETNDSTAARFVVKRPGRVRDESTQK